jgi:hypothetical protein
MPKCNRKSPFWGCTHPGCLSRKFHEEEAFHERKNTKDYFICGIFDGGDSIRDKCFLRDAPRERAKKPYSANDPGVKWACNEDADIEDDRMCLISS